MIDLDELPEHKLGDKVYLASGNGRMTSLNSKLMEGVRNQYVQN